MTDLVERLRSSSPYLHGSSAERTMADAADEIGRQQADIDKLMSERDGWLQEIEHQRVTIADTMSDLAKAEAEIEQLKAALGQLLGGHDNLYIAHFGPNSNPRDDIAAKPARAALEPKFGQEDPVEELRAEIERLRALSQNNAHSWDAIVRERNELRVEVERLQEAHERTVEWSRAYPLTVFPEPDLKKAHELLKAGGMTLDAISAHAMRHVIEGVAEISRAALERKPRSERKDE